MKIDSGKSLLLQSEIQLELIPSSAMPAEMFDASEQAKFELARHGDFTGARLFDKQQEKYRMIVSLLAEGLGVIKIGKLLQVSPNTVMAVRDREGVSVDIEKQEIAAVCRKGARLCTEAIVERLNDPIARETIAVRDLAVSAGVLIDKSQILTGGATARIEHVESVPEHDDFNSYFEKMKRVEAETIGCGSDGAAQKGVIEAEAVDHKMLEEASSSAGLNQENEQ